MSDPKIDLTKSWLKKAKRDLETAQRLAKEPEPLLDTAIYHYHQAAEKALKGFLVFNNQRFEKTHDLSVLIQLAIPFNEKFSTLLDDGEILTPYVTTFRYPGEDIEPTKEEFDNAAKSANNIFNFIINLLPAEIRL
jgi:HEPN domain-containing protein